MKLVLMFFLLLVVLSPHAYAYDTAVCRHWPQLSCPTFEERRLSLKLIKTFPRVAPRSPFPPRSVDVQSSNNASFQRFQLVSREITTTKTMPNTLRIRSRPLNTPFVYRFCLETFLAHFVTVKERFILGLCDKPTPFVQPLLELGKFYFRLRIRNCSKQFVPSYFSCMLFESIVYLFLYTAVLVFVDISDALSHFDSVKREISHRIVNFF